jgi:hypothetical protein
MVRTLTTTERLKINHPNTVLRKWQAATSVPTADLEKAKKPTRTEKLEHELAALITENHRLKREVEKGGGDLWSPDDTPEDIGAVIDAKLSHHKFDRLLEVMKKISKSRQKLARVTS